jgi:hypothetical protein
MGEPLGSFTRDRPDRIPATAPILILQRSFEQLLFKIARLTCPSQQSALGVSAESSRISFSLHLVSSDLSRYQQIAQQPLQPWQHNSWIRSSGWRKGHSSIVLPPRQCFHTVLAVSLTANVHIVQTCQCNPNPLIVPVSFEALKRVSSVIFLTRDSLCTLNTGLNVAESFRQPLSEFLILNFLPKGCYRAYVFSYEWSTEYSSFRYAGSRRPGRRGDLDS